MRLVIVYIVSSCLLLSQGKVESELSSPCDDPLIKLAEEKGIKAIPLKDMLRFKKILKMCKRQGGKEQIKQLYKSDWERDYKKARRMASWTSAHAMCVFVSFGYYFAGKVLATKPSS